MGVAEIIIQETFRPYITNVAHNLMYKTLHGMTGDPRITTD